MRELALLEVGQSRRGDAGAGQLVAQPGGGAAAEVARHRPVDRGQDLQQDEHDADRGEGQGEALPALDRSDQEAHGDREPRRQQTAGDEERPPGDGQGTIRPRQHGEVLPLLAFAEGPEEGA